MRIFRNIFIIAATITVFGTAAYLMAQESYEDYRYERDRANREYPARKDQNVQRDKPLSEVRIEEQEGFFDDLRGAVREEIDTSISKERKASTKVINENKLIKDVRRIVREEIEDAIKIKEKKYLAAGTWEAGGFISAQFKGLSSDSTDNNFRFKVLPLVNYFLGQNLALSVRGEADFNITAGSQVYYVGAGPMFVFGIDKKEQFCFYTSIYMGMSMNTELSKKLGFRYGNELGVKFILTSGVILNLGVTLAFDNAGDNVTGFQNIIIPTLGITAWF
ncbi:MAG: hypothetical protein CVV44_14655 [Spirochaetae bacterium HGW-Spirochaetae-1]|jgi:hypothetical protein|nr:MAG: hypothetical protein CVV44_14655 [Spirochaetae bacterium HGW-Spirochaetae-1]